VADESIKNIIGASQHRDEKPSQIVSHKKQPFYSFDNDYAYHGP